MKNKIGATLATLAISLASIMPGCEYKESLFTTMLEKMRQEDSGYLYQTEKRKESVAFYDAHQKEIHETFGGKEKLQEIMGKNPEEELSYHDKASAAMFYLQLTKRKDPSNESPNN